MKRNITLLFAIALGCIAFSCKKETTQNAEAVPVTQAKTYKELEKANWLLGEWGSVSEEGELTERWKKENDSVYKGESYFVINSKDTVFAEKADLVEANGKLTYIVTVPGQNNEQPVGFEMTAATDAQIVFENPAHDYPNKIVYNKISADSIMAEIFGTKNGKPATEQFPLQRR
ncbi:hypothetical protein FUA48_11445 [Flavobacterium alkalisoli]|uniref:DUF6265 domain-containing protein n=1 Tax=Flavobacterium alkalisoli TaxID=2602769 RepID=A0A5B9FV48_9FLAO|nr:DUF6265 family protein [Flavobacterium alkalisoli]QEE50169.1 hypothetical protein FUA48_11445 [Flavobacterium alkalisoli]